MDFQSLLDELAAFVSSYFKEHISPAFLYHNLDHTVSVVQSADTLARHYNLSDRDTFIVKAAAWFHDTGYLSCPLEHEQEGNKLAEAFLKERNVPEDIISEVTGCILATQMPQKPNNLLQAIVCDADMSHIALSSFPDFTKRLRKEIMLRYGKDISKEAWRLQTIHLLEGYRFHTDYAQQNWEAAKQQNILWLKDKVKDGGEPSVITAKGSNNVSKKENNNKTKPERGIETMFRITSTNNQRLSDMADKKSDILITVNSILLSAVLSLLIRKLENNQHLIIPTILILSVSVVTLIYAILATRPKIPSGSYSRQDVDDKKVNLLFFGNFYKMDFASYRDDMVRMMDDRDFLYGSLIRDVYSQGIVLGRKYRLLRVAYNIFMYGLVISVIAFVMAVFMII